jgi:hypothetical protein
MFRTESAVSCSIHITRRVSTLQSRQSIYVGVMLAPAMTHAFRSREKFLGCNNVHPPLTLNDQR